MARLLVVLVLALLGACAGTPVPESPATWSQHSAAIAAIDSWSASGKLALRSPDNSESAQLFWRQEGTQTRLQLQGPLGAGATEITSDGERLVIRRGDEQRVVDVSSPEAIRANTGWDLPLASLPHWLKGLPNPAQAPERLVFNPQTGLPQTLVQDGWVVTFERYGRFDDLTLPTRLLIEDGTTRVNVLIRQWRAASPGEGV